MENRLIPSGVSFLPTVVFPDNFLSSGWFMRRLICHNHKLGKMFSAPSHAVKCMGCDLGHMDLLPLWRAEEVWNRGRSSPDMGQWRMWRPRRKWKGFLVFQGLFFSMFENGGVLVCRFQLNMMDERCWKINTPSRRCTLCHSFYWT